MVKYHVVYHIKFQEECSHLAYSDNLSIYKPPDTNPVMINNQEKQYTSHSNSPAHHGVLTTDQDKLHQKMKDKD